MTHTVEFPGLGLELTINDTLFHIPIGDGGITVKWYGLLIALGFLLAAVYAYKRAPKLGIDRDRMFDVVLVCTVFAFIGARLYYVLFSEPATRDAYFADPITILQVWKGGLGIYGGIIMAFLSGIVMCRIRKVNTLALFDLASLGFLIGQGIGRWGNFFNQEAFGSNTSLPWGMTSEVIRAGYHINQSMGITDFDPSLPVHPTFLYESLWCILGFVLLHFLSVKFRKFDGQIFAGYIIWYGTGRFFIEGLRTDSLYIGTMRVSQLVAVLAVIGGIILMFVFKARSRRLPTTVEELVDEPTITIEVIGEADEAEKADEAEDADQSEAAPRAEDTDGDDN